MNESAHLTPCLHAGLDERTRQLGRGNVIEGHAAPVDTLERLGGRRG
ncbi:hypothetical protein AKJ09_07852 [Labilithrix luteola]|uniref:Uncharacterized protein n=1 Tax=Labilithrix luteola TaxID=1391654 RepID=A0A0K1Q638_9BACT|nr:hypothetical protein AKJ09_07852 [Labilithrix luteola]